MNKDTKRNLITLGAGAGILASTVLGATAGFYASDGIESIVEDSLQCLGVDDYETYTDYAQIGAFFGPTYASMGIGGYMSIRWQNKMLDKINDD